MIWVQVTDYRNGAYPVNEFVGKNPYSQNMELVKQALGKPVLVENWCSGFYKTVDTKVKDPYGRLVKYNFLICKKDCLILPQQSL